MSGAPLVSVVMPVRNGARFLDEAVASVLASTVQDLELVVVDDASQDRTADLLRSWGDRDPRVRVLRRDRAGGVSRALNQGVAAARAGLLARLDADDRTAPDRLRQQVQTFDARPGLGLLGTGARYIDEHGRAVLTERAATGPEVARALRRQNVFFHPSVMIRRSALEAAGGYRPALEPAEDFDLWLRIAESFEVDNLAEPLIDYRLHAAQSGSLHLSRQATAAAAARWAAGVRATGAPDPLREDDVVDEALLLDRGVPADDLRRQCLRAHRWAARTYDQASLPDVAAACWDGAVAVATGLGREERARQRLDRARFRAAHGQRAAAVADGLRVAATAPRLLVAPLARRVRGGRPV